MSFSFMRNETIFDMSSYTTTASEKAKMASVKPPKDGLDWRKSAIDQIFEKPHKLPGDDSPPGRADKAK